MADYTKLKQSADKTIAENKATWDQNAQDIKAAVKRAGELQAYFKKALETHRSNAKMAEAEYGGWSKLATSIVEKQAELAAAKKAKDTETVAGLEAEIKKLEKRAKAYEANISKGVTSANTHKDDVRAKIDALNAITF